MRQIVDPAALSRHPQKSWRDFMKKFWIVFILLLCLLIGCNRGPKTATISGRVTFTGHAPADSLFIGIYEQVTEGSEFVGDPIRLIRQVETEFQLEVEPGRYGIVVWAYPFEKYAENILVMNAESDQFFDITLPHYGLRKRTDSFHVIGDFNNWDWQSGLLLEKKENKWILQDATPIGKNGAYKFRSGDLVFYDLANTHVELVPDYAAFNNVYKGGDIVLDPSFYEEQVNEAVVKIQGGELSAQYKQLKLVLETFTEKDLYTRLRNLRTMTVEEKDEAWRELNGKLDSLETVYPDLKQVVLEERFGFLIYLHPRNNIASDLYMKRADAERMKVFNQSEDNLAYFRYYFDQIDRLEAGSILLDGDFAQCLVDIQKDLDQTPEIADALGIDQDSPEKKLLHFIEKGSDRVAGTLLYTLGSSHARTGKVEKARMYLERLRTEFPAHWAVTRGTVDKQLVSLNLTNGNEAPDFTVKTVKGESIRLFDLRGKFVMLDFWGSWCAPCRREVPNFKKLYTTIPRDSLIMIGLARDDSTKLVNYIEAEKILYPNVLAKEALLDTYGITGYPTTLLIGPDGRIIANNLRGENVIALVRDKMREFFKNKA